jgi:hypothetical protein
MRKIAWIALAGLLYGIGISAKETTPSRPQPPCRSAAHAGLDFWIGEWVVTDASGAAAGKSRVERILDGCVVQERWSSAGGGFEGMSLNTFDSVNGRWTQYWVDNTGLTAVMTGPGGKGEVVYMRTFTGRDGRTTTARMTLRQLSTDRVRQLIEHSRDGGKSWSTQYDLRYARSGE